MNKRSSKAFTVSEQTQWSRISSGLAALPRPNTTLKILHIHPSDAGCQSMPAVIVIQTNRTSMHIDLRLS